MGKPSERMVGGLLLQVSRDHGDDTMLVNGAWLEEGWSILLQYTCQRGRRQQPYFSVFLHIRCLTDSVLIDRGSGLLMNFMCRHLNIWLFLVICFAR